ncbi:hypothetical protein SCHPADRAFT_947845 [Schizopora paradoxa]|uniref:Uncharacterized protein n=1 Tax=Schizopora paradoxa TaxID=27342 RepID=A0A0H2RHB1_9AGAM|nr:hypothetical protein SCHPADRAFT_947845 [Schizopora paradoxa]
MAAGDGGMRWDRRTHLSSLEHSASRIVPCRASPAPTLPPLLATALASTPALVLMHTSTVYIKRGRTGLLLGPTLDVPACPLSPFSPLPFLDALALSPSSSFPGLIVHRRYGMRAGERDGGGYVLQVTCMARRDLRELRWTCDAPTVYVERGGARLSFGSALDVPADQLSCLLLSQSSPLSQRFDGMDRRPASMKMTRPSCPVAAAVVGVVPWPRHAPTVWINSGRGARSQSTSMDRWDVSRAGDRVHSTALDSRCSDGTRRKRGSEDMACVS